MTILKDLLNESISDVTETVDIILDNINDLKEIERAFMQQEKKLNSMLTTHKINWVEGLESLIGHNNFQHVSYNDITRTWEKEKKLYFSDAGQELGREFDEFISELTLGDYEELLESMEYRQSNQYKYLINTPT